MKPIWYFVGLMLLVIGALITAAGIYHYFYPAETVMSHLHPDIWWGVVILIAGAIFFIKNKNATVD